MKKHFALLVLTLFISSCNSEIKDSTTSSNSNTSSTSAMESESSISLSSMSEQSSSSIESGLQLKEIQTQNALNEINQNEGLTPSTGNVNILLIPIHFNNISETVLDVSKINIAFNGSMDTPVEWTSVKEFYNQSSYGKLNLNFEISEVFTPSKPSTYYSKTYNNYNYVLASDEILKEALTYFDEKIDYSKYDSNQDGYLDGIYFIYDENVDFSNNENLWWAYTSYYANEDMFDGLKTKSYVFAGYDFMSLNQQEYNTHTYIHETAHMFGIDDYYDYETTIGTQKGGLAGADIMDATLGDHNAYSKALLGWSNGKYIKGESGSLEVTLNAFEDSGDYLLLSNSFDEEKGLFQEYLILEYYTPTKLHEFDKMFTINGIRILHIVATRKKDGTLRYNNTNTNYKLISQITNANGGTYISSTTKTSNDTLFVEGESLNYMKFSDNSVLNYTFIVQSLNDQEAHLIIHHKS